MKRYYITDRKAVGGFRPLLEVIRDQIRLGVDIIQIREKDLSARELFEFALAVKEVRGAAAIPKLLVNSRADVAFAARIDGVHLPASAPRETLPDMLIARSCHTLEEVRTAKADLIAFGPVFESPGKGKPVGLTTLRAACQLHDALYALGGINWDNAAECVAAGALGVAGIRLFQNPEL